LCAVIIKRVSGPANTESRDAQADPLRADQMRLSQASLGGPAGPESGPEGRRTEETMGYALFLVIAFVMLGAERLMARWHTHTHTARHEAPPGS